MRVRASRVVVVEELEVETLVVESGTTASVDMEVVVEEDCVEPSAPVAAGEVVALVDPDIGSPVSFSAATFLKNWSECRKRH